MARGLLTTGPLVMGIVNVTPDSFSDGGRWYDHDAAIRHGLDLVAEGADIVDVGGESTRPGATPATRAEEQRRVLPVIAALAGRVRVSVDTRHAGTASAAIEAGATVVNDVSPRCRYGPWRRKPASAGWPCTCRANPARCRTTRPTTTSWPR